MKVIYHANCTDGFAAAYLCHKVWPHAEFIPANYGYDSPEIGAGEDVLIVDFSYPRDVLLSMFGVAGSLTVLDHHKTAQADLADLVFCEFDMDRSGAVMCWDYLIRNGHWKGATDPPPRLLQYVQDRDLWQWNLPRSKEVNAAIRSYPQTWEAWDVLWQRDVEDLATEGEAILRYRQQIVDDHVKHAKDVRFLGRMGRAVRCTTSDIFSEIGEALAEGVDFGACWCETESDTLWSLRSRGECDVSEIARSFGGGGHKNAAGFKIPR